MQHLECLSNDIFLLKHTSKNRYNNTYIVEKCLQYLHLFDVPLKLKLFTFIIIISYYLLFLSEFLQTTTTKMMQHT